MMKIKPSRISHRPLQAGFTLVELLVVISIILIASSIIFIGGNGGDGAALSSAQRIVSGIAQGARGQAILKNATTRLIIYSETNTGANAETDKMLRFFGIVYKVDDGTGIDQWQAATQGTYLPEGIYFDPTLSASNAWNSATMNLSYPLATPQQESGESYYYYEFQSNGTFLNPLNAWLVIRAGTLKPNQSGVLSVDFTEEDKAGLKAALIFRRAGTTTLVDDPGSIQ